MQNQRKNHLIRKKGIIENNEFNDFNNNNINIWKILFLLLINFIFITIIFINEYINMKNRIINSIIPNKKNLKIQYVIMKNKIYKFTFYTKQLINIKL